MLKVTKFKNTERGIKPKQCDSKAWLLTTTLKNIKVRGLEYKNVDSVQCKCAKSESLNKRRKELLEPDRPISQF